MQHRPPRQCPVCGEQLHLTRLSCQGCGTELAGDFETCEFCALGAEDRELLKTFLGSRGNMKALERQLGVSYPTARGRLDAMLARLGLEPSPPVGQQSALEVLQALARGELDLDEASNRISEV